MSENIVDYGCELINKILFAESQCQVQKYIDTAIKGLKENKVHDYIIERFIEKALENLNIFNPFDCDTLQWTNVQMSKIFLNRIKTSTSQTTI